MEHVFRGSWNSLSAMNRQFAIFTIATLILAILSPIVGTIAYKIDQRRGVLKDEVESRAEEQRKKDNIELNQRVTVATSTAADSVMKLNSAETLLTDTQTKLAEATKNANEHLQDYLRSKDQVRKLEELSHKMVTLQLRLDASSIVPFDPKRTKNTNVGLNLIAVVARFSGNAAESKIIFRGGTIEDIPTQPTEIVHVAVLEPENPLDISGKDIASLDGLNLIATNILQGLPTTIQSMHWTLIVNGAAFRLTDDLPLPIDPGKEHLYQIPILPKFQHISASYEDLVR